nr:amino acid permease [Bradyrhizobium sp. 2S1]
MEAAVPLRRRLGLLLLVLYGTGITVGAGIYVLIGAVAGQAGVYAPWSFLLAAVVMALTVASYAELSTRYPVSAGEAAYVRAAFQSPTFSTAIGLLTAATGVVSSATVTLGSAGYIQQFVDLPQGVIAVIVIAALAAVAAWGILESVALAALFTVIEVGGLLTVIVVGNHAGLPIASTIASPPLDASLLTGIGFGSLLACFLRFHRLRRPGQYRRGGERPASGYSPRHGAYARHFDVVVCSSRGRGR